MLSNNVSTDLAERFAHEAEQEARIADEMAEAAERLPVGTRVIFPFYDHNLTGTVTKDAGTGIVWVKGAGRERWFHRESLTVISL